MFCGGKKKDKMPQVDPNTLCKLHGQAYEYICIQSLQYADSHYKGCNACKSERKGDTFITYKDCQLKFTMGTTMTLVDDLHKVVSPILAQVQNLKKSFEEQVTKIGAILQHAIDETFAAIILKEDAPKVFTPSDIDILVSEYFGTYLFYISTHTIINRVTCNRSVARISCVYLLAKMTSHEQDAKKLISSFNNENVKTRLEKVLSDVQEQVNQFGKMCQSLSAKHSKVVKVDDKDQALKFLQESMIYNPGKHGQLLQQAQGIQLKKKIKKNNKYSEEEQQQIKTMVALNNDLVAYGTNLPNIQFIRGEEELPQLEVDGDITTLQKITLNGQLHIIVGLERNNQYFIEIYNIDQQSLVRTFNGHQGYIWSIINLPKNQIASCSDDATIQIYDIENAKLIRTIQVHQSPVNDIALFNSESIVSVSDDGLIVVTNLSTGDLQGIYNHTAEVKCVTNLDGYKFVTGDKLGQLMIFTFTTELQLLKTVQVHSSVLRFIKRVSPKIMVTSSWDGTHAFLDQEGNLIKQIQGPKKNFSEALLWQNERLISGCGGQLMIYQ